MEGTINNGSTRHYKPPFRFGIGGVPWGNEFAVVTDKAAYATLEAAWLPVFDTTMLPLVWWRGEPATPAQDFTLKNPGNRYIMICDRPKIAALKKDGSITAVDTLNASRLSDAPLISSHLVHPCRSGRALSANSSLIFWADSQSCGGAKA